MRHEKNNSPKLEQNIYLRKPSQSGKLPDPKQFNTLPAKKQLEVLRKLSPKQQALLKFLCLDRNAREVQLAFSQHTCLVHPDGSCWFILPHFILERIDGCLVPLQSFATKLMPMKAFTKGMTDCQHRKSFEYNELTN